jgi:hypothetical protein
MKLKPSVLIIVIILIAAAFAQAAEHGVMVRESAIFLAPDKATQKLANIGRGREVAVLERTKGWAHVLATVDQNFGSDRDISGWIADKGLITAATPKGDEIMFGEAVDSENEASRRGGRKGAAQDAMRLYARMAEYFPTAPLAGEALYRSADIRWQLDKEDQQGRRSAKNRDPGDRLPIEDHYMKEVRKKFPHSKWSDMADFNLIDNKLCGDWQAQSKCPEKEADIYENYAKEHPESPKLGEALYDAAWRYASLIEIYQTEGKAGNIKTAQQKSLSAAQRVLTSKATPDWTTRAQRLIYMVENNIPVFGNNVE